MSETVYPDLARASVALADWAEQHLRDAVARDGQAAIALPGGSTPGPFLAALAHRTLPWKRITLLPTDERLVAADHPRSNERMMLAHLAPAIAEGATWLSFAPDAPFIDPDRHAAEIGARLTPLLPLAILVSGMGEDGHICSLFPGDGKILTPGLGPVISTSPAGLEPRLTISADIVRSARHKALLFAGKTKAAVLDAARLTRDEQRYPVAILVKDPRNLAVFAAG